MGLVRIQPVGGEGSCVFTAGRWTTGVEDGLLDRG